MNRNFPKLVSLPSFNWNFFPFRVSMLLKLLDIYKVKRCSIEYLIFLPFQKTTYQYGRNYVPEMGVPCGKSAVNCDEYVRLFNLPSRNMDLFWPIEKMNPKSVSTSYDGEFNANICEFYSNKELVRRSPVSTIMYVPQHEVDKILRSMSQKSLFYCPYA